ncbi:membrane fusion protein, multidrug efflux system [Roseateles sp. YR242]|uniref:HlyD family secretion protein n=1 Tax=Roseateles sp. YR242 TaxID=1855305 RepID=UPI0008B68958|nr:HlyD family secretion protein [Roseateles sp. YR242]SEL39048.1 membrane fusion protein, multidrug efflux system [Roseateles sp. YR242]
MLNKPSFRVVAGAAVVLIAFGALWILNRPESGAPRQETDDAYVRADFTVIAPQVAGAIQRVAVEDHQAVKAGDLLVQIDDRDLRIAVEDAKARAASAGAVVSGLSAQIQRQHSLIGQAGAALTADEANLKLATVNLERFTNLAKDGSGTLQAQQQAEAQLQVQRAARDRDRAAEQAAREQLLILQADLEKARADALVAKARQADAELKLSYTRVVAPTDGVVDQRGARVGGYVRVGESLLTLVPMEALYVEANFRETQLARVQVGQPVHLGVDALPGVTLEGHVESLAPASGVSFSPVPPHNATGNFTKIVQRLPVRIRLDPGQAEAKRLRVGMSVRPLIDTAAPVEVVAEAPATATTGRATAAATIPAATTR